MKLKYFTSEQPCPILRAGRKITLSEAELISALKRRDDVAMDALYSMYYSAIHGTIQRIVQHDELADDLLQETFVRIWRTASLYDERKGRLLTWMLSVARNIVFDSLKSRGVRNAAKTDDIEECLALIEARTRVSYNPELLGVKELVVKLKPELQQIIDLLYFKGFTHVEAAEELNIPLGTLKTRVRLAIAVLRRNFN